MTRTEKIIAGMQIILKYDPGTDFAAEHDVIYFGGNDLPITDEDRQLLEEYGWREFTEYDCWGKFV